MSLNTQSKSKGFGLTIDGWKNRSGSHIYNFLLHTTVSMKKILSDFIDVGASQQTTEYIYLKVLDFIEKIGETKFFVFVSDTPSVMKGVWKLIHVMKHMPWISAFGCCSHIVNLLAESISRMGKFKRIIAKIRDIAKFCKRQTPHAVLKEIQQELCKKTMSLTLPNETRWNGTLDLLVKVSSSRVALERLCFDDRIRNHTSHDLIDHLKRIKANICDEEFWMTLDYLLLILKPIGKLLDILQSDCAILSDAPRLVEDASNAIADGLSKTREKKILSEAEIEQVKKLCDKRFSTLQQDIMFSASMLDPRVDFGSRLSNSQKQKGMAKLFDIVNASPLFQEHSDAILLEFCDLRNEANLFSDNCIAKKAQHLVSDGVMEPGRWWASFFPGSKLAHLAEILLSMPITSATNERNWSIAGNLHSKNRNRLGTERLKASVLIKHNRIFEKATPKMISYRSSDVVADADDDIVISEGTDQTNEENVQNSADPEYDEDEDGEDDDEIVDDEAQFSSESDDEAELEDDVTDELK